MTTPPGTDPRPTRFLDPAIIAMDGALEHGALVRLRSAEPDLSSGTVALGGSGDEASGNEVLPSWLSICHTPSNEPIASPSGLICVRMRMREACSIWASSAGAAWVGSV